jgi:DNA-binding beta-propeller fold protein YncE
MKHISFIVTIILTIGLFCIYAAPPAVEISEAGGEVSGSCNSSFGVFLNADTGCIKYINPSSNQVFGPYLKGWLDPGGMLMDVVITSDGNTAIATNFEGQKIFFIDISGGYSQEPTISGTAYIGLNGLDMDITPDNRYLYITGGLSSPNIAVVDMATRCLKFLKTLPTGKFAESISVTPNGQTVIATDYTGNAVHTFKVKINGQLKLINSYSVAPFQPVNSTVSPNGKTVIITLDKRSTSPIYFTIGAPGYLDFQERISLPARGGQGCVFSSDSTKAYFMTTAPGWGTQVHILNVDEDGRVTPSGTSIDVFPGRPIGAFYGVENIALEPSERYLYVTNSSIIGGLVTVEVLDLKTNTQVMSLMGTGIPTGIAFTCNSSGNGGNN